MRGRGRRAPPSLFYLTRSDDGPGGRIDRCVAPGGLHESFRIQEPVGVPMRGLIVAMFMGLTALPAAAQSLEERLPACLACHGEKGQSETPDVPSLGGQPEFYLTIQLYMFREKLRVVEIMNDVTKGLSDDDLRKVASTIAKLPPPRPGEAADPARSERTQAVIGQNRCNFCHTRNFAGEQNVPRLAGQREDYL